MFSQRVLNFDYKKIPSKNESDFIFLTWIKIRIYK